MLYVAGFLKFLKGPFFNCTFGQFSNNCFVTYFISLPESAFARAGLNICNILYAF